MSAYTSEAWLGELLAVIHCDGGHYLSEHGVKKATEDAIAKRNQMVRRIDELETQLAAEKELRKRWERKTEETLTQLATEREKNDDMVIKLAYENKKLQEQLAAEQGTG